VAVGDVNCMKSEVKRKCEIIGVAALRPTVITVVFNLPMTLV